MSLSSIDEEYIETATMPAIHTLSTCLKEV